MKMCDQRLSRLIPCFVISSKYPHCNIQPKLGRSLQAARESIQGIVSTGGPVYWILCLEYFPNQWSAWQGLSLYSVDMYVISHMPSYSMLDETLIISISLYPNSPDTVFTSRKDTRPTHVTSCKSAINHARLKYVLELVGSHKDTRF